MAQSSGPISQGTDAERQMTDTLWRSLFGDESGVRGDMDGSSYTVTLPSDSDGVSVGSTTQDSLATVAGFSHRIPQGSPESITIPDAVGTSRTDVITLRYDPAFTGLPGPVRLNLVAGTSSAIPAIDDTPPGVEDLPLWAITRAPGQPLSQATVLRMFQRIAPSMEIAAGSPLPSSSPLGTVLQQGTTTWYRRLNGSTPEWRLAAVLGSTRRITTGGTASGVLNNSIIGLHPAVVVSRPFGQGVPFQGLVRAYAYVEVAGGGGSEAQLGVFGDPAGSTTQQARFQNKAANQAGQTLVAESVFDTGSADTFAFQPIVRAVGGVVTFADPRLSYSIASAEPKDL